MKQCSVDKEGLYFKISMSDFILFLKHWWGGFDAKHVFSEFHPVDFNGGENQKLIPFKSSG
jgi:hypothetical protein